ncbi:MAG: DUF6514 family protein [Candidatus Onthomonas sp.]
MKREWEEEQTIELENGETLGLDYWLLTDQTCWGESYGVAVTDSTGREEAIRHVTTRRIQALELLRRMARCTVTTVTAAEVVDDFLLE